jgi:hypothetical protein
MKKVTDFIDHSRTWLIVSGCVLSTVFSSSCCLASNDENLKRLQRSFSENVRPLLNEYCSDCHSGSSASAGFDFEQFETVESILAARKRWKKLEALVISRQMPPADCDPLNEESFETVRQWLADFARFQNCDSPNPGRVTLRRLNRVEYQNTIRDLIGIDYRTASDFPGDDVGYGFDNIADVISLPPILMEKYLTAAEEITTQAIVDPRERLINRIFNGEDFKLPREVRNSDGQLVFITNSRIEKALDIPQTGDYRIVVYASGDQAGDEPVRMTIGWRGGKKFEKEILATGSDDEQINVTLRLKEGPQSLQFAFINDYYKPATESTKTEDRNLRISQVSIVGPLERRLPEAHTTLIGQPPGEESVEQLAAAEQFIQRLGSRAFRRTLAGEERQRLLELYALAREEGDGYEVALRDPLQAILISPHFLFKVEQPLEPGQTRSLNDFELATSLSYFLWSSMPDEELFQLAEKNQLRQPEIWRNQIKRMLADPKSIALVDNFVVQWLQLSKLERMEPDPTKFPLVDLALRQDMIRETKLLVGDLIGNDRSILDLLSTEYTFVNQRLAEFYGLENIEGEAFQKINSAELGRRGLLTQASILTVTSNPNRTSPVKRGKWIMENLLGEEPPPPDPSAMLIEDQPALTGNLRQRLEQHRADPSCAVCHQVMDQLGFALEHFDAVGRWRENDEGLPIDSTGELPSGHKFSDAIEMQRMIRDDRRDEFVRCLTEKMLIYATGRGLEYFDDCAVDKIIKDLKERDYRFTELILLIASSEAFMKRRG